jgi:3-methyl-2-oxobutanoate hydroxymethyltransferase
VSEAAGANARPPISAPTLAARKGTGERTAIVTAYDATFARLAEQAGLDAILVGDSLGMVIQGHSSTLPVTLDEMVYHTRLVSRGAPRSHVVADMPFLSYQASLEDGIRAAGRLLKEGGASAVKVEGGATVAPLIGRLVSAGIPVMAHVGMTPQSLHVFGGFKVQGRTAAQRARILEDALAVSEAGAYATVIESVPRELGAEITRTVRSLTIGIGAGPDCDGQVLVMHDLLGLDPSWKPRFARRYAELGLAARQAFSEFAAEVRSGAFPRADETFE